MIDHPNITLQRFLNRLALSASSDYRDLLSGIAEHFQLFGELSAKQRKSVRISASKLNMPVPDELEQFKSETTTQPLAADDMFSNEPMPELNNPLVDMLREIATALNKAAERLA